MPFGFSQESSLGIFWAFSSLSEKNRYLLTLPIRSWGYVIYQKPRIFGNLSSFYISGNIPSNYWAREIFVTCCWNISECWSQRMLVLPSVCIMGNSRNVILCIIYIWYAALCSHWCFDLRLPYIFFLEFLYLFGDV